jgi:hypothetical protein
LSTSVVGFAILNNIITNVASDTGARSLYAHLFDQMVVLCASEQIFVFTDEVKAMEHEIRLTIIPWPVSIKLEHGIEPLSMVLKLFVVSSFKLMEPDLLLIFPPIVMAVCVLFQI